MKRVVIDFSSPNIAKPFHFGHLKSTILGNYLANLHEFLGYQVTRLNYIGDWGTQYGLLNLGLDSLAKDDQDLTIKKLVDSYVIANEKSKSDALFYEEAKRRFSNITKNTADYKRWQLIKDISMKELLASYQKLGIRFDKFEYESQFEQDSIKLVKSLSRTNSVVSLDDGAVLAEVMKNDATLQIPLLKSDGSSLYISRELTAAISRQKKYNFDKMLYVVGSNQEKHFHCLKEIIRNLGHSWADQLTHVKMGKVVKMSTRSGEFVLLSDIINEATERYVKTTKETPTSKVEGGSDIEEVGQQLALSALFVYDMAHRRTTDYEFNWDKVMRSGPSSGVNLQTTYARLCSLLNKAADVGLEPEKELECINSLECIEAINLMDELNLFDVEIEASYQMLDPSPIVRYAQRLCKAINRARRSTHLRVVNESDPAKAKTRLTLFKKAAMQLKMIIELIGLKPLNKV